MLNGWKQTTGGVPQGADPRVLRGALSEGALQGHLRQLRRHAGLHAGDQGLHATGVGSGLVHDSAVDTCTLTLCKNPQHGSESFFQKVHL